MVPSRRAAPLAGAGTLEFTFLSPQPDSDGTAPPPGTMLAFLRFCCEPDDRGFAAVTMSNHCGAMPHFVG